MKIIIVISKTLAVMAIGVFTFSLHNHFYDQEQAPRYIQVGPRPQVSAQEGEAWTRETWTGDSHPYQEIERSIDHALADGKNPWSLVAQYQAAAQADANDPQTVFRWAYSQWEAITPPYGSRDNQVLMWAVFRVMHQARSPDTYEYARLRYLIAPADSHADLTNLGERLLRRNPADVDVKYRLLLDYDAMISRMGLRTKKVDPAARRRAVAVAQELIQTHLTVAKYHAGLGGVYATCYFVSKDKADADNAIKAYQQYLRLASPNDRFRSQAEVIIKSLQAG